MLITRKVTLHSNLIDDIHTVLLSNSPDLTQLHASLEKDLNLSSENAQSLIYQVVAQLNAALFSPIIKLELIHTEGCNLACSYCFEKSTHGHRRMPLNIAKAAIDLLFDYSQNEPLLYITHFGGEPTLNFSAIQYVTEYAERKASPLGKSVDFNITTNGVLLNKFMIDYFAQHKIKVLLSIDGLEPTHNRFRIDRHGHGTFERVMLGFELLKKVQPWIGVKMTVMPSTASNLFDNVLGLYEMGVNQFIIGYATGVKWSRENMESYSKQLSQLFHWYKQKTRQDLRIHEFEDIHTDTSFFGCQAGRNSISIAVDGEISPCSKILALNNKKLLVKLGDVWHGLTHLRNRLELVNCSLLRTACEDYGIAENFQGGCFASNFEDNQNIFQPSMQDYAFSRLKRSICLDWSSCKQ